MSEILSKCTSHPSELTTSKSSNLAVNSHCYDKNKSAPSQTGKVWLGALPVWLGARGDLVGFI